MPTQLRLRRITTTLYHYITTLLHYYITAYIILPGTYKPVYGSYMLEHRQAHISVLLTCTFFVFFLHFQDSNPDAGGSQLRDWPTKGEADGQRVSLHLPFMLLELRNL